MTRGTALLEDDDGLSVVVGGILLVAIVIILSATIWYAVNRVDTDEVRDPPSMGFLVTQNEPSVKVITAPGPPNILDWFVDLRIGGDCTPTLNGNPFPDEPGTPVEADDLIGCEWGETLRISASQERGNALLFVYTFPSS